MARGTRLFQQPRSPLIQGRSRQVRPWWQPYVAAVVLGLLWPIASRLPHEIAEAGGGAGSAEGGAAGDAAAGAAGGLAGPVVATLEAWVQGLGVIVPAVLIGAAIGVGMGTMWGTRFRWVPGAIGAIGAWYAALVVVGLFG